MNNIAKLAYRIRKFVNCCLQETVFIAGFYVGIQIVSGWCNIFVNEVESQQLFDDTPGQDDRGFIESFACQRKCLPYVSEYYSSLEPIFYKIDFFAEHLLGDTILFFYLLPCVRHVGDTCYRVYWCFRQKDTGSSKFVVSNYLFLCVLGALCGPKSVFISVNQCLKPDFP